MSILAIGWAFKQKIASPVAKLILVKLADNANDNGYCWPSLAHLEEHCSLDRRNIPRYIKQLEEAGFIEVVRRTAENATLPNHYIVKYDGRKLDNPPSAPNGGGSSQ